MAFLCRSAVKRDKHKIVLKLCETFPLISVDCCYELNCDDKRGECDDTEKEQKLAKDLMSPKIDVAERELIQRMEAPYTSPVKSVTFQDLVWYLQKYQLELSSKRMVKKMIYQYYLITMC